MEFYSGYWTPAQSQDWRETLSTPEESSWSSGGEAGVKKEQKEEEQVGAEIAPSRTPQLAPALGSFPTFSSHPTGNNKHLNGFPPPLPFMSHLPQETVVKVEEGADGMGHLDPHYLEQYRGQHLPSLATFQMRQLLTSQKVQEPRAFLRPWTATTPPLPPSTTWRTAHRSFLPWRTLWTCLGVLLLRASMTSALVRPWLFPTLP